MNFALMLAHFSNSWNKRPVQLVQFSNIFFLDWMICLPPSANCHLQILSWQTNDNMFFVFLTYFPYRIHVCYIHLHVPSKSNKPIGKYAICCPMNPVSGWKKLPKPKVSKWPYWRLDGQEMVLWTVRFGVFWRCTAMLNFLGVTG